LQRRPSNLCNKTGDYEIRSRLLPVGHDHWVHTTCGFWSSEVILLNGELLNIMSAIRRGKNQNCSFCKQSGATIGCSVASCPMNYHPICALLANCIFKKIPDDKYLLCYHHAYEVISGKSTFHCIFNIQ